MALCNGGKIWQTKLMGCSNPATIQHYHLLVSALGRLTMDMQPGSMNHGPEEAA